MLLPSPMQSPIVNEPAGIKTMPLVVGGTSDKRKNLAAEELVTETATCEPYATARVSVAGTQFGEARLVVLSKTQFVPVVLVSQKRIFVLPAATIPKLAMIVEEDGEAAIIGPTAKKRP